MERMRQERGQEETIPPEVKEEIMRMADPENNTGYAVELAQQAISQAEETIQTLREVYDIAESGDLPGQVSTGQKPTRWLALRPLIIPFAGGHITIRDLWKPVF